METIQTVILPIEKIKPNEGQIQGLPANPRAINEKQLNLLKKSIKENPEMLSLRELLVYPIAGYYVIIGGNMRYMAMRELMYEEAPCKVIPESTTPEQLRAYTIKDNVAYGEWDKEELGSWDQDELEDWGVMAKKIGDVNSDGTVVTEDSPIAVSPTDDAAADGGDSPSGMAEGSTPSGTKLLTFELDPEQFKFVKRVFRNEGEDDVTALKNILENYVAA